MTTQSEAASTIDRLLHEIDAPAREVLDGLQAARFVLAEGDAELASDLDRAELDFLKDQPAARTEPAVEAAARAQRTAQLATLEGLPETDTAALFDLAELRADFLFFGESTAAARAEQAIGTRLVRVVEGAKSEANEEGSEDLRFEAGERYAVLTTEEEDLELEHRLKRLEQVNEVLSGLGDGTGDKQLRRIARRLARAANERRLQLRLEKVLTRRGAAFLENLSFVLLIVVFITLAAQWVVGPEVWLIVVDGSICVFFIVEFLFKLALVPDRRIWFLRNALTDLLPAIPAAILLMDPVVTHGAGSQAAAAGRVGRLFRIVTITRYVRALRPLISVFRLILFLVRGVDSLVRRFSSLLNRSFVFFEQDVVPLPTEEVLDDRTLAFRALRREHVLIEDLSADEARSLFVERAGVLGERLHNRGGVRLRSGAAPITVQERTIPVEHAIEALWRLEPDRLPLYLPKREIQSLDRLVRIINAPIVRELPAIRSVRSPKRLDTPEERVVDLGRRVALALERARERVLVVADMHGIVTGPQILDRVASAMVQASKRPATRLLMFGGGFALLRLLVGDAGVLGRFLEKFVALPLVILGVVCLGVLVLGRWLKSLAGEAADEFRLTSEAHFIGLTELHKRRHQDRDLQFLAERVFRWELGTFDAIAGLAQEVRGARTGELQNGADEHGQHALAVRDELYRVALLYLHFLDGAPLHQNDVTSTQQLLANLSLENIRNAHLETTGKDRKRLRKLAPNVGGLFKGPYVWFHFVTESVALETAKRVTDYNRHCLTIDARREAPKDERDRFARWLRRRRVANDAARLEKTEPPGDSEIYRTTEFNALDFLTYDPQRERHVRRLFGAGVLRLLRRDRERMIREIFGTQPLHELDSKQRTVNVYRFYNDHLSNGRVFLLPFFAFRVALDGVKMSIQRVVRSVREILTPDRVPDAEHGRASFAVALRKLSRMKGPVLIEALTLRARFDPAFCGAPTYWSGPSRHEELPEVERDMDYLLFRERDREEPRDIARRVRRRVEELHRAIQDGRLVVVETDAEDDEDRRYGERAVTIAWITDQRGLRTLTEAEHWFDRVLPRMESRETRIPKNRFARLGAYVGRRGRRHPVDRWIRMHCGDRRVSRRGQRNLIRAYHDPDYAVKRYVDRWLTIPVGAALIDHAHAAAQAAWRSRHDIARELAAVRAVQSLSVLDIRNYRELIFELGNYGEDEKVERSYA